MKGDYGPMYQFSVKHIAHWHAFFSDYELYTIVYTIVCFSLEEPLHNIWKHFSFVRLQLSPMQKFVTRLYSRMFHKKEMFVLTSSRISAERLLSKL